MKRKAVRKTLFLCAVVIAFFCQYARNTVEAEEKEFVYTPAASCWQYEDVSSEKIRITGLYDWSGNYSYDDNCYLVFPDKINGKTVTEIKLETASFPWNCTSVKLPDTITKLSFGEDSSEHFNSLKTIELPDGIKSIGSYAFYGCNSLQSVIIPDSVTQIGAFAFSGCSSLQSVTIPVGVSVIGEYTFFECEELQSVTIPEGVKEIGDFAFYGCKKLQSVKLPSTLKKLDKDYTIFADCRSVQKFEVAEGNSKYYTVDDALFYTTSDTDYVETDQVDENGDPILAKVEKTYRVLISYPAGKSGTFTMTADMICSEAAVAFLNATKLTDIYVDAENQEYTSVDGILYTKDMKVLEVCPGGKQGEVIIPDGVEGIQTNAFSCSNISALTISDSVKWMGYYQFYDSYDKLQSLTIGKNFLLSDLPNFKLTTMKNLKFISISDENSSCKEVDNAFVYNSDMTILEYVVGGYEGDLILPDSVEIVKDLENIKFNKIHYGKNYTWKIDDEEDEDYGYTDFINNALKEYTVSDENTALTAKDGVLYTKDGKGLVAIPLQYGSMYTIPEGVETIYCNAVQSEDGIELVIPQSVERIDWLNGVNKIYGYEGSKAEQYAKDKNITFCSMGAVSNPIVETPPSSQSNVVSTTPSYQNVQDDEEKVSSKVTSAPKSVKVTGLKVNLKKKTVSIRWNKTSGAKKYQIQYATNKKFGNAKTKTTSKNKLIIKKLKKGKTYYIRVRVYQTSESEKIYGAWSRAKKVRVKK